MRDMNLAEDVSMDPRPIVQPFCKAKNFVLADRQTALRMLSIPRLSFPWASLSGSEIQSNLG